MNILNIHGYGGNSHNAAYMALQKNGCSEITAPAIDNDSQSPEIILERLQNIIADKQIKLIVGTSLGGFFAAALSAEKNIPVILVNPCLLPFLHLPRLGFNGDVKPFVSMFGTLAKLDSNNVSCIVGDADEVLGSHAFTEKFLGNTRFRRIDGGKHSGSTLPLTEYFLEMMNYYKEILPTR